MSLILVQGSGDPHRQRWWAAAVDQVQQLV
jgi:hypothetical protein